MHINTPSLYALSVAALPIVICAWSNCTVQFRRLTELHWCAQEVALFDDLTVSENLEYTARLRLPTSVSSQQVCSRGSQNTTNFHIGSYRALLCCSACCMWRSVFCIRQVHTLFQGPIHAVLGVTICPCPHVCFLHHAQPAQPASGHLPLFSRACVKRHRCHDAI